MVRRGFSLVEMLIVLLILAVVAGAVVLRIGPKPGRAALADITDRVLFFDHNSRVLTRQRGEPINMVFNLAVCSARCEDKNGKRLVENSMELPARCSIAKLMTAGRQFTSSSVSIHCSPLGLSPSYAVLLEAGDWRQWVLISGLTGQPTKVQDEKQVKAILQLEAGAGQQRTVPG